MKNFTYSISTKILFGENQLENIGKEIKQYTSKILIVYGSERIKKSGLFEKISDILKKSDISYKELSGVKPNPDIISALEGIKIIKEHKLGFILGVGGGSVIDAIKAMAAGAAHDLDPWLFCTRKATVKKALPIGSVLTLSATGSEMNGNSVISNEKTKEKLPFGSDLVRPRFSVLDPTLTYSVPQNQTAAGVVDIFTHVGEQYFQPTESAGLTDRISEAIMKTCIQYGEIAMNEPQNYEARANLMWASSLALNGLLMFGKDRGDWATHQIEHELSAAYDITHGIGLAIVFPNWMRYVLNDSTVERFAMYADNVWEIRKDDIYEQAKAGIEATSKFFKSLNVPLTLSEVDIDDSKIAHMAKQATQFGDLGNFMKLSKKDVEEILKMCL